MRATDGGACLSLEAELSSRSAFESRDGQDASEAPIPGDNGTRAWQITASKNVGLPSEPVAAKTKRPFLRKGTGKARSQPPKSDGSLRRLQPRGSFEEAAEMLRSVETPQKAPSRHPCSIDFTPPPAQRQKRTLHNEGCCPSADPSSSEGASGASCFHPTGEAAREDEDLLCNLEARHLELEADFGLKALDSELEHFNRENQTDSRLLALDREIERFRQGNEALRRLRERAEHAQLELQREQAELRKSIEDDRRRLQEQVELERQALKEEKESLEQEAERSRLAAASERLELRAKLDAAEEAMTAGERKWQATIERMQRQFDDLATANESLRQRLSGADSKAAKMSRWAAPPRDPPPKALSSRAASVPRATRWRKQARAQAKDRRADVNLVHPDGRREVAFPNGLRKVVWPDGRTSVLFQNGDVKESHPDGTVVYRYSATNAVQTTYPDGSNVYCFSSGQVERHYADGSKEVDFPDGTKKNVTSSGAEEVVFPDGAVRRSASCTE